jgi:ligand-binding sensor domain-containing protein
MCWAHNPLIAQDASIYFESYTISDGLSQSSIHKVHQDKQGYLWVATQAGVDRYDGYRFQNMSSQSFSGTQSHIEWCYSIFEPEDGVLWFGDQAGRFSKLDRSENRWTNERIFYLDEALGSTQTPPEFPGRIQAITQSQDARYLYLGTNAIGLIRHDLQTGQQKHIKLQAASERVFEASIYDLQWSMDKLWIASEAGLFMYDPADSTIAPAEINQGRKLAVRDLLQKPDGGWLVATNSGLYESDGSFTRLDASLPPALLAEQCGSVALLDIHFADDQDKIWLIIENMGIALWDTKTQKVTAFKEGSAGLNSSIFLHLLTDRQGIVWVASYTQGLLKYDPEARKIKKLDKSTPVDAALGFETVWGTLIDQKNRIWVGDIAPGGGIYVYDRELQQTYHHLKGDSDIGRRFWAFAEDAAGVIWILHNQSGDVLVYKADAAERTPRLVGRESTLGDKLPFSARYSTHLTQGGDLLISGAKDLIRIADAQGNTKFDRYGPLADQIESRIIDFFRASDTLTYVMTVDGLYKWYDGGSQRLEEVIQAGQVDFFEAGASNDIQFVVYRDSLLYIPIYGKGLYQLDINTLEQKYLGLREGLVNRYLYTAYLSEKGTIWMSSNYGIIAYNPENQRFRSFGPNEGAQDYEFNANSSYQSESGELALGGLSGLNYFHPSDLDGEVQVVPVLVEQIRFGTGETKRIESEEGFEQRYELEYSLNSPSFEYLSVDLRDAEKIRYRYRLEGLQDSWIEAEDRRFASFTNLLEGQYTFRVQAQHPDALDQWQEASFSFRVLPPWYRTIWAYGFYLIILGAFIYLYNQYRVGKEQERAEQKRRNDEMKAAQELQQRMLPEVMPNYAGYVICAHQETSTEVGGDYYDFFEHDDGSLMVVCGDATGHGTAAGMLVSVTKAGLNALQSQKPHEILKQLNRVVKNVNVGMLRMSLVVLHIEGNRVQLSSAAMPPVYIYRAATKAVEELMISDLPLGAFKHQKYSLHAFDLDEGDCCVLLSDGLPEATNSQGVMLDYDRVKESIKTHAADGAEAVKQALLALGSAWIGGTKPEDDITFVVVEKTKN